METENVKTDLKETLEMIEGIKLLAVAGFKIAEDGKISLSDLAHLSELVKNSDKLMAAVKGSKLISKELKDLDDSEIVELGLQMHSLLKAIRAAKK